MAEQTRTSPWHWTVVLPFVAFLVVFAAFVALAINP